MTLVPVLAVAGALAAQGEIVNDPKSGLDAAALKRGAEAVIAEWRDKDCFAKLLALELFAFLAFVLASS